MYSYSYSLLYRIAICDLASWHEIIMLMYTICQKTCLLLLLLTAISNNHLHGKLIVHKFKPYE